MTSIYTSTLYATKSSVIIVTASTEVDRTATTATILVNVLTETVPLTQTTITSTTRTTLQTLTALQTSTTLSIAVSTTLLEETVLQTSTILSAAVSTTILTETDVVTSTQTDVVTTTSSPGCPAVPFTCTMPTFYIQITNGSAAGQYVYIPRSPRVSFIFTRSTTSQSLATQFTIDSLGRLSTTTSYGVVYSQNPSTPGGLSGTGVYGEGTVFAGYSPVYVQLGCGPSCPAISGSGNILLSTTEAPYNGFGWCNGVTLITVNGGVSGCTGGENVGYPDALTYITV